MTAFDRAKQILDEGGKISVPFMMRKFQISYDKAKEIYEHFFPTPKKPKRKYYFEEMWKNKKR